jgi:hypothetical protein
MSWQVSIHVKNSNITCKPKGGNVHAKGGNQFRWFSPDAPFTLVFTDFDTGAIGWPFQEPQPKWPVEDTKILTVQAGGKYIKYFVQSAGCEELDPVIIVDKT